MPGPLPLFLIGGVGLLALLAGSKKASAKDNTPPGPLPSCPVAGDNGIAGLPTSPTDYRGLVMAAIASPVATPDALDVLAAQLVACGQGKAGAEVKAVSDAKKAIGGGPPPDIGGGLIGTTGIPGGPYYAEPPSATGWIYTVADDDYGPIFIVKRFFGVERAVVFGSDKLRYVELVQNNPGKATVGDPKNPMTTKYNFKELTPGERLIIPVSWNAWIGRNASGHQVLRGAPTPFPPKPPTT